MIWYYLFFDNVFREISYTAQCESQIVHSLYHANIKFILNKLFWWLICIRKFQFLSFPPPCLPLSSLVHFFSSSFALGFVSPKCASDDIGDDNEGDYDDANGNDDDDDGYKNKEDDDADEMKWNNDNNNHDSDH